MSGLIPVFAGRPPVLKRGRDYVYVSVHDQWHLRERSRWRARLAEVHPDAGGSASAFRAARKAFERWLAAEQKWYAELGLEPPRPSESVTPPIARAPRRTCATCPRAIGKANRTGECRRCRFAQVRHPAGATKTGVLLNYRPLRDAPEEARAKIALITWSRSQRPHGTRRGDQRDPIRVAAVIAGRRSA